MIVLMYKTYCTNKFTIFEGIIKKVSNIISIAKTMTKRGK